MIILTSLFVVYLLGFSITLGMFIGIIMFAIFLRVLPIRVQQEISLMPRFFKNSPAIVYNMMMYSTLWPLTLYVVLPNKSIDNFLKQITLRTDR